MRLFSAKEQARLKLLTRYEVSLTLIEPTRTGLNKSILDATELMRGYLKDKGVHDYSTQKQGSQNKVIVETLIYSQKKVKKSKASLYRPLTKQGDPRLWFYGLKDFSKPNDIIAIIYFEEALHVFNLTQLPLEEILQTTTQSPLKELIESISSKTNEIANELLSMLRKIARSGPIPSEINADTSVGRTLETALGIDMNSSEKPDYKGIEIKSFRANKPNRKNLFAQVPDWNLSKFKSSAEILEAFGYQRGNDFKLYCTVSALTRNSQGLMLKVDPDLKQLIENSDQLAIGDFVIWRLDKLHHKLLEKHRETFWVSAESLTVDNRECFRYTLVEHTKKPIISQFDILLMQGIITLDHLIKKNAKGKVVEKGPIFKIKPSGIETLFPPAQKYKLL